MFRTNGIVPRFLSVWGIALVTTTLTFGSAQADHLKVLHAFGVYPDGEYPNGGLLRMGGNLYGTTNSGGTSDLGTIFEVAPDGTETILYTFSNSNGGGFEPYSNLIADKDGNVYGTTSAGGAAGYGTVFKLAPGGTLTILHSFAGTPNDGSQPYAGLIADKAGNFYGTTDFGGSYGYGAVFKLSADGTLTLLHSFPQSYSDGWQPQTRLVMDKTGNLYGTTLNGGAQGDGAVFKVEPDGTEVVLHSFTGGSDGILPFSGLILDKAGNIYGTAAEGGNTGCFENQGCGIIFELAPDGTESILHTFTGGSDGGGPHGELIADSSGNLSCCRFD
jgi:uncharacterized repeat protein (TIGR03803 family)